MIYFNRITKSFKTDLGTRPFVALSDVSFEIPAGSMVGFLGANGAGKTTSLKIIMDFIRPTSGEVKFAESLGRTKLEVFKNIGFLPERPYFYPNLTGEDFLIFLGQLSELSKKDVAVQIKRWAPRFRLEHALKRELKTYSKGMLQRIGFLSTILHHPQIVILDEPLSGLDPIGRKELKDVIVEVHREGKTVFFSSHIVPDIEEICDRVIFLRDGKLAYDGAVSTLTKQATLDYEVTFQAPLEEVPRNLYKERTLLPESVSRLLVASDVKEDLLRHLLERQARILGVEAVRPSLEEIFYHTGKSDASA